MEIKGKTSVFKTMLEVASLAGTFDELGLVVAKDAITIQVKDSADKTTIMSQGIFGGFEGITVKETMTIGIKVPKVMGYLKELFGSDEEISWTIDDGDLLITGSQDIVRTALLDPKAIKYYTEELDFTIDEEQKVALYKKGSIKPTTIVELDSAILKGIAKRASIIGQEYYPINLEPPNKIFCDIGSRKDKTKDVINFSSEEAMVKGEPCQTTLGKGFKEVVGVLKGNILMSGLNPEKTKGKQAPLWIYQKTDEYEVGFFIAPRLPE